jgi:hypothetical protein
MKFRNIKNLVLLITAIVVTAVSCKKTDFAINTNPDDFTASTVDYRTVLPSSIASTATIIEGTGFKFLQNWMGYWARSGSFQDVTDEESYIFDNDFSVAVWNNLWTNLTNFDFVQQKAVAGGAGYYEAVARIMKAHDFQILVDIYGNVPYTQALKGNDVRTPAYDKGKDIYDSLFVELDRAIVLLKDPIASGLDNNKDIETNDIVFHGDAAMWVKFANTLKLRMLVHAFQAPGFDVAGKVAIIEAEGSGYLQAGESAHINPGYSATKPTPYFRAYVTNELGVAAPTGSLSRANAFAVGPNPGGPTQGYYQWDGDPRVNRLYVPPASGVHKGIPYGAISGDIPNVTGTELSTVNGPGLVPNGAASRAWILTSVESLFLQSEAQERGMINSGSTAKDLLTEAIHESFVWLGLTTAQADTYIVQNATYPDVDYDGVSQGPGLPAGGIFTILSQKWFALNAIAPYEVWTDWRRTDVVYGEGGGFLPGPPISINPARPTGMGIPIRLFYPQNEYNYNAAAVAAQGVIDVSSNSTEATGRIFWDIN